MIEDNPALREGLRGTLAQWGCPVVAAPSTPDALDQLSRADHAPELLVCDYRLAGDATGIAAIGRLRAAHGRDIPALLISADAAPEVVQDASRGLELLHKPVRPMKLRALLDHLLAARRMASSRKVDGEGA